jgi:hypothetical protein
VVVPAVASTDAPADPADEDSLDVLRVPTVHELLDEPRPDAEPEIASLERRLRPEADQAGPAPAHGRTVSDGPSAPAPPPADVGLDPPVDSAIGRENEETWEKPDRAKEERVRPPASPAPPGHLPERRVVVIDDDADLDRPAEPVGAPVADEPPGEPPVDIGATLEDVDRDQRRRWRLFRKGGE